MFVEYLYVSLYFLYKAIKMEKKILNFQRMILQLSFLIFSLLKCKLFVIT